MTEAIAFDTHKFIKHLTEHGFTEEQAEVLADEQVNLLNSNLATKAEIEGIKADIEGIKADIEGIKADIEALRLATKADIEALRLATKADIEALRQATKAEIEALRLATQADIANLKADLLKWMIGALIAQGGVIVTLISLIVN